MPSQKCMQNWFQHWNVRRRTAYQVKQKSHWEQDAPKWSWWPESPTDGGVDRWINRIIAGAGVCRQKWGIEMLWRRKQSLAGKPKSKGTFCSCYYWWNIVLNNELEEKLHLHALLKKNTRRNFKRESKVLKQPIQNMYVWWRFMN